MKITKINANQINSLSKIGINEASIDKIEHFVVKSLNDFFDTGDFKSLNFVESISFISRKVDVILQEKKNNKFFYQKLKSIRKAVLDSFEVANGMRVFIDFEVFPSGNVFVKNKNIDDKKIKNNTDYPDSFPRKYWTRIALQELAIDFTVGPSKERVDGTEPYDLFFVSQYNCVIAVANEYGKATYFLPLKNWKKFAKFKKVDDLRVSKNVQFFAMPSNFEQCEWTAVIKKYLLKMSNMNVLEINKSNSIKGISKNETEVEKTEYYKKLLEVEIPRLMEDAGLAKYEDKYVFSFFKYITNWGRVGNLKMLKSFPNGKFLRENLIIEKGSNQMTTKDQLKELFKVLGFLIADKAEEKLYYKQLLEVEMPRLIKDVGLIHHEGKYIFNLLRGKNQLGKIGDIKNLKSFPNPNYLVAHEIIKEGEDQMTNQDQLKKLFESLGIPVASEVEEKEYYKELLELEISRLITDVGLVLHEDVYYFSLLKGNSKWGKINNLKNIRSFPNREFLRKNEIIKIDQSYMSNAEQLKQLFKLLKLPVATERQELEYLKNAA